AHEPRAGLHFLCHRARHGPDRSPVRPGDRHGAGRKDCRGPDGRNSCQSANRRGLFRLSGGGGVMALIELKHVVAGYGGAPILNGVNIAIEKSDIGVIVGPNGAGKSTTLKAIFGLLKVTGGTITFAGEDIANSLPDRLVPK